MRFHWPIIGKGRKDQLQDAAGAADLGDRNSGAERRHQSIRKLAGRFGGVVLQPTLKLNDDMAEPADQMFCLDALPALELPDLY